MGNLYVLKTFYHLDDVVLISCKYWCCVYTRHKRKYWEYYVCILLLNHIRRQLHLRFSRQPEANTRPKTTRATHTLIHISIHSEFVYLPRSINANAVSICLTWLYVCVCVWFRYAVCLSAYIMSHLFMHNRLKRVLCFGFSCWCCCFC